MSYDNPWIYNGVVFDSDDIGEYSGFIYLLTNIDTGMKYIGKKNFYSLRTLPPLKGKTRKRKVTKESDWKKYYSSSDIIKDIVKNNGGDVFKREILSLHLNKSETNYAELVWQIKLDILSDESYYNGNIDRVFYRSTDAKILAGRENTIKQIENYIKVK